MIILVSVILTILVFSLLIIVHELGHFFAAKLSGVTVNEFWLGMGPTLYKKHYKGTDYQIKAFPFGGAVVMEGEDGNSSKEGSFARAPRINRAIILVAGCVMNFILGFIIVVFVFLPTKQIVSTSIDSFANGFLYYGENGLLEGDEFLSIDGYKILVNGDVSTALSSNSTGIYDIVLLRDGEKVELKDFEFLPAMYKDDDGEELYRYGMNFAVEDINFIGTLDYSFKTCLNFGRLVWVSLGELVSGNVSVNDMSGPVGITVVIGQAAEQSMSQMWFFVAFISINLGVMNLLPLPALDGGRLLILAIESIRRKPIKPEIEGFIHGIGLLVLLGLIFYVTMHDIFVKILGVF